MTDRSGSAPPGGAPSSSPEAPSPEPRLHIPEHRLVRRIDRGAYGEVWLAQTILGSWRAVKIVRRLAFDSERPYEREYEGLRKYEPVSRSHAGLVQLLQIGRDDPEGFFYYVMELADPMEPGAAPDRATWDDYVPRTLRADLARRSRLPVAECLEVGLGLALALEHLHRHGLVHRDIKPSNVIFVKGVPKLADIGLVTEAGEQRTRVGTTGFMPPEGGGTPRGDVFSLGKLLYELATGKSSHRYPEPMTDLGLQDERAQLCELDEVLMGACANDPDRRYPTVSAMRRDLLLLQAGESLGRRRALERALRTSVRAGIALTVIAVLSGVAIHWAQVQREGRLRAELEAERTRAVALDEKARLQADLHALTGDLAVQRIEQLFADDRAPEAIGHLARLLRVDPANRVALQRLMSALTSRTFGFLVVPPLPHGGEVYTARFDREGRRVVTASRDGTARVWDATRGIPITLALVHDGPVRYAEFDAPGARVVTASEDGSARIWDARTGQPSVPPLRHEGPVGWAAFDPEGARVATASSDRTARLWDAATGAALGGAMEHEGKVNCVQFSPDGRRVVTASEDSTAQVWTLATLVEPGRNRAPSVRPTTIFRHGREVLQAAFSPDGRWVVSASTDFTARVWDAETGVPIGVPLTHGDSVRVAEFSPDGLRVVTASWDRTARVWEARTGEPVTPPLAHSDRVRSARFSPDGLRVVTASTDHTLRIWNALTGEPLTEPMRHDRRVRWAEFRPDNLAVVSASEDGTARVWEGRPGSELPLPVHSISNGGIDFSRDGRRLVVSGVPSVILDTADPSLGNSSVHLAWSGAGEKPVFVRFSPDGSRVAASTEGSTVLLWDAQTGQRIGHPMIHARHITALDFSPDGRRIATASFDGTAQVCDGRTGALLAGPLRHSHEAWAVQFHPDGRRVVTASLDGTARIWDAMTGDSLGPPLRHGGAVLAARFSPDGRWVATVSGDNTARLWDAATGSPSGEPLVHPRSVNRVVFSPDGATLLTATEDGTAWLWDVRSHAPRGRLLRHEKEITAAEFSLDGRMALTASADGRLRVWDVASGHPLTEPWRYARRIDAARFSPDGALIATATKGEQPVLWRVTALSSPPSSWVIELAMALAGEDVGSETGASGLDWRRIEALRERAIQGTGGDAYFDWGRWFFGDRARRSIAFGGQLPVCEYVQTVEETDAIFGVQRRLLIDPASPPALVAALRSAEREAVEVPEAAPPRPQVRFARLFRSTVEHWIQAQARRHPGDRTRVWLVLFAGNADRPIHEAEDTFGVTSGDDPGSINGLLARGVLLDRQGRHGDARTHYARALRMVRSSPMSPEDQRNRLLLSPGWLATRTISASAGREEYRLPSSISPRDPATDGRAIDLSAFYNAAFHDPPSIRAEGWNLGWESCLDGIRVGRRLVQGTEFDIRGMVQAMGEMRGNPIRDFPPRVDGIPIGRRYRRLHFLHAFGFPWDDQSRPSQYVVHYADGGERDVPLVQREDAGCWMEGGESPGATLRSVPVDLGRTVWGRSIVLYHSVWENPLPDVEIRSLDLVAGKGSASPFLVALTGE